MRFHFDLSHSEYIVLEVNETYPMRLNVIDAIQRIIVVLHWIYVFNKLMSSAVIMAVAPQST